MNVTDSYPLVVVANPYDVRDWYVRHLGFSAIAEADWFVYLTSAGPRPFSVCFMREGLDHQLPQFRTPISGNALMLTLEVDDAEEALHGVVATGVVPDVPLRDEPWGQRHFMLRDPAGVWIDVVQIIDPDPNFLDQKAREQLAALNNLTG